MSQAYKILFTVTLRHEYYASKACNDFTAIPTDDCSALLNQYHLVYRQAGNKIIVLTPAFNGEPVIEMNESMVFRFYLLCNNVYFSQFSNWNQDFAAGKKFYATNQHNNFSAQKKYLTIPLAKYNEEIEYHQGQLVVSADGTVHECLQFIAKKPNSKPLTEEDFWRKLKDNKTQYVTTQDQIAFTGNLIPMVAIPGAKIKVEIFDNDKKDFKIKLLEHTVNSRGDMSEVNRIFPGLPPGRYKLTVNNSPKIIYFDPCSAAQKAWGLIEVHHDTALPGEMNLLDGKKLPTDTADTSKLTPVNFIIHFHNRSVLWRYFIRLMKTGYTISDSSGEKFAFEKKESSFISKQPIPVTEEPLKTLTLKKDSTALVDVLKNPAYDKLNVIERKDPFDATDKKMISYLCSDMYLTI